MTFAGNLSKYIAAAVIRRIRSYGNNKKLEHDSPVAKLFRKAKQTGTEGIKDNKFSEVTLSCIRFLGKGPPKKLVITEQNYGT